MNIDFPFQFDKQGHTALTSDADHIRDLIEGLLFTVPGERVNRPDFGSGLLQTVFEPNSAQVAAALQYLVQSNLNQYLGELIQLEEVSITNQDATLTVTVRYLIRRTQEERTVEFERSL